MTAKPSLWAHVRNFFSPPTESYDTRVPRPGDAGTRPGAPIYEATDRRRAGGSMEIGG